MFASPLTSSMVCSLCGRDFAFYTANICLKCGKLNAATSDAEKNIIMVSWLCTDLAINTTDVSRSGDTPVRRL